MFKTLHKLAAISLVTLPLITSCTETQLASHVIKRTFNSGVFAQKKTGHFKVGKPYKIKGNWYTPEETYNFSQTGVASWYGPNFHGKATANGETFNRYELTAAHKTLQLPSIVRVTNLENGRSLIVRVNDRGPYSKNRIIDLSDKSADLLGFKSQGTAKVRVDVLEGESKKVAQMARQGLSTNGVEIAMNKKGYQPINSVNLAHTSPKESTQPPIQMAKTQSKPAVTTNTKTKILADPKPSQLYVQAGAFSLEHNAQNLVEELKIIGNAHVHPSYINGKPYYRVRFGPFASTQNADIVMSQLVNYGNNRAMIVVAER